ncbi:hypothetical protein [Oceanithermus sp.]
MKRRLTRIGNSWGLVLSRDLLELLRLEPGGEVEVEVVGNTLVLTAPEADPADLRAALAYLDSKLERQRLYRRLADA